MRLLLCVAVVGAGMPTDVIATRLCTPDARVNAFNLSQGLARSF